MTPLETASLWQVQPNQVQALTQRKKTEATQENVKKIAGDIREDPKQSYGDIARQTGVSKTTVRRIANKEPGKRIATQMLAQRVKQVDVQKRLNICAEWAKQMGNNWELGPRQVY